MRDSMRFGRILLTGGTGQVGWELIRTLSPLGEVLTPGRDEFNLANPESLREKIDEWRPDLIVNAAAYTAVDKAESEYNLAFAINADAPKVLAEEANRIGAILIHYSTDYIFDGKKKQSYIEEDAPNPLNVYGNSKLNGEQNIQATMGQYIIIRTAWVYSLLENNFLRTMLRLFEQKDNIRVVSDQMGGPTWARMIAEATAIIVAHISCNNKRMDQWGVYNLAAQGCTSWYGFAVSIKQQMAFHSSTIINPILASEYGAVAQRPLQSCLSCDKIQSEFGLSVPDWHEQLKLLKF